MTETSTTRRAATGAVLATTTLAAALTAGCGPTDGERLHGQVGLTLLHTSDIHARLFPYSLQIGHVDANLGLGEVDNIADVGGAARISHIIGREKARASRVLYVDTGDPFQGAPVFNYYDGEAEMRALSNMGLSVMVLGNHEFDKGALNAGIQIQNYANFPVIVANYMFEDPTQPGASPLGAVTQPYMIFDVDGLRVATIGMGSLSSLTSIYDMPNRLGVTPLQTAETVQFYVDLVRPIVDVVIVLSHLGVNSDQEMIKHTTGIDVVLGGHNHIVLQPPKHVLDCARVAEDGRHFIELNSPDPQDPDAAPVKQRRYCAQREVILSHPGAFAKYVGRMDLVVSDQPADFDPGFQYDDANGFEVVSVKYDLFPVNAEVPEDPTISALLEPFGQGLDEVANLDLMVGYAPQGAPRYSTNGGDSALGNMIATAAWLRLGVQTDFSMTNTTGIRADIVPGPVSIEQMFNIFPFDNSIAKMQVSGIEVQELFDFVARRSAGRGCTSQVQIAGARLVLDCQAQDPDRPDLPPGKATHIYIGPVEPMIPCASDNECCIAPFCTDPEQVLGSCDVNTARCWQPISPIASYELATSNYLANGGSGFTVLQRNTTQFDTQIQQRDALIDFIRGGDPCGSREDGTLWPCHTDADCVGAVGEGYVCACSTAVFEGEQCLTDNVLGCPVADGVPGPGDGACVLARCRDDVAEFERQTCENAQSDLVAATCAANISPCQRGGEQCKFLTCIDANIGNMADGRVRMVGK